MPHDPYKALYLHLPFCVKRCAYCDFATAAVPAGAPEIEAYVEDLSLQIRRKACLLYTSRLRALCVSWRCARPTS